MPFFENISTLTQLLMEHSPIIIPLSIIYVIYQFVIKPLFFNPSAPLELSADDYSKFLIDEDLKKDPKIENFYVNTTLAWKNGELSKYDESYSKFAKKGLEVIKREHPIINENALWFFLNLYSPLPNEYLIGYDKDSGNHWYFLTNLRQYRKTHPEKG